MKMEPLNSGDLRVWMTNAELRRWGLEMEHMQDGSPTTERALIRLWRIARSRMPCAVGGRVTVEALPLSGGYLFLFSCTAADTAQAQVFSLDSAEAVLQLGDALAAQPQSALPFASLYRQDAQYLLIVYAGFGTARRCCRLLEEYGECIGEGDTAVATVEEHATAVTVGDALHRLCAACGSR